MPATAVAPHTGAWIETVLDNALPKTVLLSRPTRARGLKLRAPVFVGLFQLSRPTRARGLKRLTYTRGHTLDGVAPHTGAWIETRRQ